MNNMGSIVHSNDLKVDKVGKVIHVSNRIDTLNNLAQEIMQVNNEKGFNDKPLDIPTAICLMHSELSEALEADRKDLMDDKIPTRTGLEVELADCIIRILHLSARKGFDMEGAVREKLEFNKTRAHMHGGKKY